MIQRACHDRHTHVYVYTCIHRLLPIPRVSPREREGRVNVVAAATLSGKRKEEEMICTGRTVYIETKAPCVYVCVCVCLCVYVSLSVKPCASCDPQNVGELKGVDEEIHLASLTV